MNIQKASDQDLHKKSHGFKAIGVIVMSNTNYLITKTKHATCYTFPKEKKIFKK